MDGGAINIIKLYQEIRNKSNFLLDYKVLKNMNLSI